MRAMALTDRKVMSFDMAGTLIDFEAGILDYVQARAKEAGVTLAPQAILDLLLAPACDEFSVVTHHRVR